MRHLRSQFAHHLRARGVAANATERAVRGQSRKAVKDGIYQASRRGASTYLRAQAESVAKELVASGTIRPEPGKRTLLETREAVESGWRAVAKKLEEQGAQRLAADVVRFVGKLAQPLTDREWLAREILATARVRAPAWQREAKTL